jgi:hypothetical protein
MKKFLVALARSANVTYSAHASGLSQGYVYTLRQSDKDFAAAWEQALESAIDRLEQEAWRRAIEGEEEYVISGGHIVLGPDQAPLKKSRKSDVVLLALLRAHRRKYRFSQVVEHSGSVDINAEATERVKARLAEVLKISVDP